MGDKGLGICVLGGTGFVGTELVTKLAEAGHTVRVPTRNLARGNHLKVLPTVQLIAANVQDGHVLGQLFDGMDVVINLVGILNERGRETFRTVHAELAGRVVDDPRPRGSSQQVVLDELVARVAGHVHDVRGRVLATVPRAVPLAMGEQVIEVGGLVADQMREHFALLSARQIRARAGVRYEELREAKGCAHPRPHSNRCRTLYATG